MFKCGIYPEGEQEFTLERAGISSHGGSQQLGQEVGAELSRLQGPWQVWVREVVGLEMGQCSLL